MLSQILLAHKQVEGYKIIVVQTPVSLRRLRSVSSFGLCDHVSSVYLGTCSEPISDDKAFPYNTANMAGD